MRWSLLFFLPIAISAYQIAHEFEQVSTCPRVYVCEHFLSDEECDHIITVAEPFLQRATVVDPSSEGHLVDSSRTSLGMFIPPDSSDSTIKLIEKRISEITGIPEENGESIQVLYYGVGAQYRPHYDFFDVGTTGGKIHYNRGGQRAATFIVYLNSTEEGGETIFPKARIAVVPKKGKALLFYNLDENGNPDPMSLHGGVPVIKGEKWIMTRWLREHQFD